MIIVAADGADDPDRRGHFTIWVICVIRGYYLGYRYAGSRTYQ
jgi:hypothetical protein